MNHSTKWAAASALLLTLALAPCLGASSKLANGLTVLPVTHKAADVCAVHVALNIGIERTPQNKPGLGSLAQQALLAHMQRLLADRPEFAALRAAEGVGASLAVQASWDDVEVLGQVTSRDLPALLRFLSEGVFNSDLTQDDIVDAKEVLAGPGGGQPTPDDPALGVYYLFRRALVGDSPLSQPLYDPKQSDAELTLADVRGFCKTFYVPNLASVCVVAPMSEADIAKAVSGAFASHKSRDVAPAPAVKADPGTSRVIPATSPVTAAAILMVGVPVPQASAADHPLALVLHAALSGPRGELAMDKSLNVGLAGIADLTPDNRHFGEEDDGLFPSRLDMVPMPLSRVPYLAALAACPPRNIEEMRQGVLGHFAGLSERPLSDETLGRARLRAMGLHAAEMATPAGIATYVNRCQVLGIPYQGEEDLAARIAAVTATDVQEFAKANFGRHAIGVLLPGA